MCIRDRVIATDVPSPFAHNLIVLGEADIILMGDRKQRLLELYNAVMKRIGVEVAEQKGKEK